MQRALQLETVIDQDMLDVLPALEPLLGHRVQIIALDAEPQVAAESAPKISFDEFLTHRLTRPKGTPTVTLEDMEEAIIKAAMDGNL